MSLHVDGEGKVHDESDPGAAFTEGGHRLSDGALSHLPKFELPHLDVPAGVYVALGLFGVAVIGTPFLALYLLSLRARAMRKVVDAAAPVVAQMGPALLPLVPEAAPVVAAASLYTAARGAPQGAPAASGAAAAPPNLAGDVATLLAALRRQAATAQGAPPSGHVSPNVTIPRVSSDVIHTLISAR